MKALIQLLVLIATFFLMWFAFSKIDFLGNVDLDKFSQEQENKLGDLLMEQLKKTSKRVTNDSVNFAVNQIVKQICTANNIDQKNIKSVVLVNSNVNAFALPGDHLVVLTGAITYCKTPEELAGVMAHEIAHIEKDHVMKKLIKEVGISMLFVIAGGEGTFEIINQVLKLVSSSAFDRDQETEADLYAVKLLTKAQINPSGLADFLFRLSGEQGDLSDDFEFLSTHPGSAERTETILSEIKKNPSNFKPLEVGNWEEIKELAKNSD